ncbi:uncharacterized protein TRAVEDRAFT_21366 [Trametes versicolor FP-101664 SS1]|uniref:uncharacterized protein n=1 Tax=Trametes versicolor (strain FP-101664) TaxID=717944 RepID=UPI0004622FBB|nr:uncharacterized protein TRAVEDRAFT_21366 [Trametes versicolor FP-101664 SS1]EIW57893.1 hypothetical protein TRAVEDRAFT_21366 [Trametes versicolor FP-101664 SS1]
MDQSKTRAAGETEPYIVTATALCSTSAIGKETTCSGDEAYHLFGTAATDIPDWHSRLVPELSRYLRRARGDNPARRVEELQRKIDVCGNTVMLTVWFYGSSFQCVCLDVVHILASDNAAMVSVFAVPAEV